jgi:hypothetical protein
MNKIKWGVLDVSSWQQKVEVFGERTVLVILCSPQSIGTIKNVYHPTIVTNLEPFLTLAMY